ncbi:hypothetical protein K491DRAFT_711818 [Lophiostoma macrostomum CBS 122681]|uniref:Uncharacterized protein n=1 Tax=Lophiostoma macrostomum CBS 122681 TaxID=1314788 RepID=A0A6A6TNZ5_9PLEO|nr:hypothetical protein K491DRAFT_711818 [Lophiostoma macrostomum CBS 122681]
MDILGKLPPGSSSTKESMTTDDETPNPDNFETLPKNIPGLSAYTEIREDKNLVERRSLLTASKVFDVTKENETCTIGGRVYKDLPRFDDASRYGLLDDTKRNNLVQTEIQRLLDAVNRDEPPFFNDAGLLGEPSKNSLRDLSHIADQVHTNFVIVKLDNTALTMEYSFQDGFLRLLGAQYQQDAEVLRMRFFKTGRVKANTEPVILQPETKNKELYFNLVDFVTASTACHLLASAYTEVSGARLIAILALWSVKLKILYYSPVRSAIEAVETSEDTIRIVTKRLEEREFLSLRESKGNCEHQTTTQESKFDLGQTGELNTMYYTMNFVARDRVGSVFIHSLASIHPGLTSMKDADDIHASTLVYATGLERTTVVLHEDREGEVDVSPDLSVVRRCHVALATIAKSLQHVRTRTLQQRKPPTAENLKTEPKNVPDTEEVVMSWGWTMDSRIRNSQQYSLRLPKMVDVVSILVHLSMSSPKVTSDMCRYISDLSESTELLDKEFVHHEPWKPGKIENFQAKCTVSTSTWVADRQRLRNSQRRTDCTPLTESPLRNRIRAGTVFGSEWTARNRRHDLHDANLSQYQGVEILQQYEKEAKKMDEWVFHEDAVEVRCKKYVFAVLSFCAVLILGALAVPFTVGDRIAGVDPFQIVTFSWLVVGVILVAAKSRYVSEWPWHEFLHGTVFCRSVSDLANLTGVSDQVILVKLLDDEGRSINRTRGPYNGMFRKNKSETGDGFAIDTPARLSTMLASGFIVLKVLSDHGDHLLVLDARKETAAMDYARSTAHALQYFCCKNIDAEQESRVTKDGSGTTNTAKPSCGNIYRIKWQSVSWAKLGGLYVADSWFG